MFTVPCHWNNVGTHTYDWRQTHSIGQLCDRLLACTPITDVDRVPDKQPTCMSTHTLPQHSSVCVCAQWGVANQLHGQQTEPSCGVLCQGLPRKTDQFRFEPKQSCATGKKCDRFSSVYCLAPREVLRHLPTWDQPWLCPACILSLPSPKPP